MSSKAFLVFIILSLAVGQSGYCQFTPYSLYSNSPVLTQVAYPGSHDDTEIWINYRQSRMVDYNSPSLSMSHPLFNQSGRRFGGIGASVINESWANGLYRSTGFVAGFAYVLPVSRQHSLSMGLQGGLISNGLNDSKITTSSQYQLGAYNPAGWRTGAACRFERKPAPDQRGISLALAGSEWNSEGPPGHICRGYESPGAYLVAHRCADARNLHPVRHRNGVGTGPLEHTPYLPVPLSTNRSSQRRHDGALHGDRENNPGGRRLVQNKQIDNVHAAG